MLKRFFLGVVFGFFLTPFTSSNLLSMEAIRNQENANNILNQLEEEQDGLVQCMLDSFEISFDQSKKEEDKHDQPETSGSECL